MNSTDITEMEFFVSIEIDLAGRSNRLLPFFVP